MPSRVVSAALFIAILGSGACFAADWPQFGCNSARSRSAADRTLTPQNVSRLHLIWRASLGDVSDSEPIASGSLLFITANNGTTYGIDAADGRIRWHFETHGPGITTSSPALAPSGKTIFVAGLDGFVHQLDAATGKESRSSWFPVRITLIPDTEKNASSLTVANGFLYAATSGYFGDAPPYVGHVVAVRLSDGSTHVFNTLCANRKILLNGQGCDRSGSGIWSRGGVVVDPDPSLHGRIYAVTGNGDFNAAAGGNDYGDSIVSLSADASHLVDYYTPSNYAELDSGDTDLGSSSPGLLPRETHSRTPLMLVQGGKDNIFRLLDRERLGGVGHELQRIDLGTELFSSPAIWQKGGRTWIFLGLPSGVRAFRLQTGTNGRSTLHDAWTATVGGTREGTSPAASAGLVFVAMSGAIYALDAMSGKTLWSGPIGGTHWQSPIVADGMLYCADGEGHLSAFGLR